jgi:hypothetical protein
MTQLSQTQPRSIAGLVAGVALAAALLGGIAGSGIQALLASPAKAPAPVVAPAPAAVIEAANAWAARYRQMYPESR